jgi:hypothetical protein
MIFLESGNNFTDLLLISTAANSPNALASVGVAQLGFLSFASGVYLPANFPLEYPS